MLGIILGLQLTASKYKNQYLESQRAGPLAGAQPNAQGQQDPALRIQQAEKDENGCIIELNYIWDRELGVCVRYTDIPDEDKEALTVAIEHVGREYGLRIRSYLNNLCDTCYKVKMASEADYFTVRIKDGGVVNYYEESGENAGVYTTTAELVYNISAGLMGFDPAEFTVEKLDVSWNDGTRNLAFPGIGNSVEDVYDSGDVLNMHTEVLDGLKDIGFETDDNNVGSSSLDYDLTVLSDRDNVCNILLERSAAQDTSMLQVACAEY